MLEVIKGSKVETCAEAQALSSPCLPALERGERTRGGGRREWRPFMGDQEPAFLGGDGDFLGLSRFRAAAAEAGNRGGRCSCCLDIELLFIII